MARPNRDRQTGWIRFMVNVKVSDGSQPPMTFDLSLSEAASRSLYRQGWAT
jgi:hypothetical protein